MSTRRGRDDAVRGRGGSVIGAENNDGILQLAAFLKVIDQAAEVEVQILYHGRVQFLGPGVASPVLGGQFVPGWSDGLEVVEFRARGHHTQLAGPCHAGLTQHVVSFVIASGVAIQPIFGRMQRPVGRGVRNETEPRRLTGVDELDHPVGVVVRGVEVRRQILVLDGLAVHAIQAVVVPEDFGKVTGRGAKLHEGAIESPGGGRIAVFQAKVPLAGDVSLVARILQQFGDDCPVQTQPIGPFAAGLGRPNLKRFGDVCAGHHHDSSLLAGTVSAKIRQTHAGEGQFVETGGGDFAPEGAYVGVSKVIGDDEKDVGPRVGHGVHGVDSVLAGGLPGVLGTGGHCAGNGQGQKLDPRTPECIPGR